MAHKEDRRWLKEGKASIATDLVSPYPACPGPPSSDPANLHHSCVFLIKLSVFCLPAMFINAGIPQEPLRRCCHCSFPDHHYSSSSTSFSIIVIIGLVNDHWTCIICPWPCICMPPVYWPGASVKKLLQIVGIKHWRRLVSVTPIHI